MLCSRRLSFVRSICGDADRKPFASLHSHALPEKCGLCSFVFVLPSQGGKAPTAEVGEGAGANRLNDLACHQAPRLNNVPARHVQVASVGAVTTGPLRLEMRWDIMGSHCLSWDILRSGGGEVVVTMRRRGDDGDVRDQTDARGSEAGHTAGLRTFGGKY